MNRNSAYRRYTRKSIGKLETDTKYANWEPRRPGNNNQNVSRGESVKLWYIGARHHSASNPNAK